MSTAEIIVVGAGIVGTLTAWELRERGFDVLVLERDTVASGASGGPGKRGVRSAGRDARELPLAAAGRPRWDALASRLGIPLVSAVGGLTVTDRPVDGSAGSWSLRAQAALLRAHGIPTEVLDAAELRAREPSLGAEATGAVFVPRDGVIDHGAATLAIAEAARAAGVRVEEGTTVMGIGAEGRLDLAGGLVSASTAIVLAANTSVRHLLTPALGDLPLWAASPQMNFVRPRRPVELAHLVNHTRRPVAIKTAGHDGEIMISGGSRGRWDDALGRGAADAGVAARAVAEAASVVPGLEGATIETADASRGDSWSVDGVPVIDRLGGAVPTYFATGWSGHGFAIAPAVARSLAEWVTHDRRPRDLEPFGLERLQPRT